MGGGTQNINLYWCLQHVLTSTWERL